MFRFGKAAAAVLLFSCPGFAMAEDAAPAPAPEPAAAESPAPAVEPAQAAWDAASAAAVRGPGSVTVKDQATLDIPAGYAFIPVKEAAALMTLMGNRTGDSFAGMITAAGDSAGWFTTVDYLAAGYIHDDDAKEWNAEDMLQGLKQGTDEANAFRAQQGVKPIEVTGWIEKPRYDAATHRLVWSVEIRDKGTTPPPDEVTVNYNTYVLGREGYVSMDLVTSAARVEALKPVAQGLLAGVAFKEGKRYADFNPDTDRVAEYGLAALIGGVAAKKLGLLAMLGVMLAKFWKLMLVAVAAGGGMLNKLLKRKPPEAPAA